MSREPTLVADVPCETGENPLWHPEEELLYWCDIPQGDLYAYDPAIEAHEPVYTDTDGRIGGFTVQDDGTLLLFGEAGTVERFDPADGRASTVVAPNPDRFGERFNDVIADPEGRVFCGVMPDVEAGLPGELYRLDPDGSFAFVRECVLPNGMGFTPDLDSFYFTDSGEGDPTCPGYVYRYAYDRATGAVSDPEVLVDASAFEGFPDGMTVDADGDVWSAFWNGHALRRFAPDGTHERTVRFGPRKVSSLTFGGRGYTEAYVTTAGGDDRATEGEGAGSLFRVDLGVRGREAFRSRIET